ncbi:MAG: hypothetical protein ABI557_08525 [Aureliella sp.]
MISNFLFQVAVELVTRVVSLSPNLVGYSGPAVLAEALLPLKTLLISFMQKAIIFEALIERFPRDSKQYFANVQNAVTA